MWTAVSMVVVLAVAGAAVDVNRWYSEQTRLQATADAAAQAGVVFLPDNPATAITTARTNATLNGYTTGSGTTVSITQDAQPTRLNVNISRPVGNSFLRLLGFNSVTVSRSSTAEYSAPASLGSPLNRLGRDPDTAAAVYPDPNFWVQMAGPGGGKVNADRYAQRECLPPNYAAYVIYRCSSATTPRNTEFDPNGYRFVVNVTSTTSPLVIEIFDGQFLHEPACSSNDGNSPARPPAASWSAPAITTKLGADAPTRYGFGGIFCPGDGSLLQNPVSSYDNYVSTRGLMDLGIVVRSPDNTPWTDLDNPIVTSCSTSIPSFRVRTQSEQANNQTSRRLLYDVLRDDPINPNDGVITLPEVYHRWFRFCTINNPQQGEYIVQTLTSARVTPGTATITQDTNRTFEAQNRFSLRAGIGNASVAPNLAGVTLAARSRLPIFSQIAGTANFYLTKIPPTAAGRTMYVEFWDIGDGAGSSAFLQVLPPADANISTFGNCSAVRDTDAGTLSASGLTMTASTCTLSGLAPNGRNYDGRMAQVRVPIPAGYTCNPTTQLGCWVRLRIMYGTTAPTDGTTWAVSLDGDPVRLIR